MSKQIFWEDVVEGMPLPPLSKIATTQMLVKWAGATGDFVPLHYDEGFAKSQGLPNVLVHGLLKQAWLLQLVSDWMGDDGTLKRFTCQYRGMDFPRRMKTLTEPEDGETWTCRGKVVKKYVDGQDHCVDLEVGVENGKGENTTPGTARVVLPARGAGA